MNPFTVFRALRGLVAAALLFGFAPGMSCAQSKSEAPPASAGAVVRLDIEFPSKKIQPQGFQNTPLRAAVDLLLSEFRAAGIPVNAVFKNVESDYPAGEGISFVNVPPISLRQVTFEQAIQALVLVAKPSVTLLGDANLFVIEKAVAPTKVRVINASEFLLREGRRKRDDRLKMLRSAVTKAISLGQLSSPQLELDDDSGLLFATGSPEALEIVAEVARALSEGPPKPRFFIEPPASAALPNSGTPAPQTKP